MSVAGRSAQAGSMLDRSAGQNVARPENAGFGGRTILLFYSSSQAGYLSPLARTLKRKHGFRVILLSTYENLLPSPRLFDFKIEDFDEVHFCGDILKPRVGDDLPSRHELAEQGWELERRFGISALDLLRVDRVVGIDFVVGADFHRSKFGDHCTHDQAVDIALRLARTMEAHLLRLRPVAIVGYPGSVFTNALISIGEAQGVPMRYLWPPRRGNFFSWICDRWGWPDKFQSSYEEEYAAALLEKTAPDEQILEKELKTSERFKLIRARLRREASIADLCRKTYRHVRRGLPDIVRGRTMEYGDYRIREKVRMDLQTWRSRRRALRETPKFPSVPSDQPFVFFPLHLEPEISLMVECASADNQLTFIDWLAKALPAGWLLLVKEHPAQSSDRLPGFWEQVHRYPNVEVLASLEGADEVIARATAVAVINGTVGFQAANLGIPVLTFHKHYLPVVMPHVRLCESYDGTRQALREIAGGAFPEIFDRRAAARAFDRAMGRSEFPITNNEMLAGSPARSPMAEPEFDRMVDLLMATLTDTEGEGAGDPSGQDRSPKAGAS